MIAGESGADYVLFGEPDAQGQRPSPEAIAERVNWWAELFEPPCVAYAAALDEVHIFAAAGADFVLLAESLWNVAGGPAAPLTQAMKAIQQALANPAAGRG
jgi:thiamine-phosphate pyrophosphorylase